MKFTSVGLLLDKRFLEHFCVHWNIIHMSICHTYRFTDSFYSLAVARDCLALSQRPPVRRGAARFRQVPGAHSTSEVHYAKWLIISRPDRSAAAGGDPAPAQTEAGAGLQAVWSTRFVTLFRMLNWFIIIALLSTGHSISANRYLMRW